MTDLNRDEYWSSLFDITQDDLMRIAERMERDGMLQDLKALATRLVRGRLEHGHDPSPAVLAQLTGKASVRLWDPSGTWQIGDLVLVATKRKNHSEHEAFLGEVIIASYEKDGEKRARIKIEELHEEKNFVLAEPGSERARNWHEEVRVVVEKKLQSGNLDQEAEGIVLKHGERILSRLEEALQSDSRFTGLEGKWYITKNLPSVDHESLRIVHRTILQKTSVSVDELLPVIKADMPIDKTLLCMAIHSSLQKFPERFENTGTSAHPQWKARIPEPSQAEVTHYAYDPNTYEILCRPGQRLNQKNAQRLHELNLYAHVVTFAE